MHFFQRESFHFLAWIDINNCVEVPLVRVVVVVIPLLGFGLLVRTESGREVKFYHHLATVRFLRNKRIEYSGMNVLLSLTKLLFMWWVIVFVFKDCLFLTMLWVAWWITISWVQGVFMNSTYS